MTDRPSHEKGFEAVERSIQARQNLDEVLNEVLGGVHHEARQAIELRFGIRDGRQRSWRQVAEEMGVSESTARRKVGSGLKALPKTAQSRQLKEYF